MKKKIIASVLFLLLMASIPFFSLNNDFFSPKPSNSADKKTSTPEVSESESYLAEIISGLCTSDDNDETIKAICILLSNNSVVDYDKIKKDTTNNNSDKELLSRVEGLYNSISELRLYFDNEIKYVPYSICSSGTTLKDKSYPYLEAIASPFDCFSDKYSQDNICVGVSLEGIRYLCENGLSAKEALLWYIPNAEIKKV